MGADDQVILAGMYRQVPHRNSGHPMRPLHPSFPSVEADKKAELCPEEEEVLVDRVFFDHMHKPVDLRCGQAFPGLPEITGHIDIRGPVGPAVVIEDHVSCGRVEFGGFDMRNPGGRRCLSFFPAGQVFRNKVPGLPIVLRHLKVPVIGSDPDHAFLHRARSDTEDRGVVFRVRDIQGQTAAFGLFLLLRVIGGQIRADDLPGSPFIRTAVDELTSEIDGGRFKGVHGKTGIPVVPVLDVGFGRDDAAAGPESGVKIVQVSSLGHAVSGPGFFRVGLGVEPVAASDCSPQVIIERSFLQHIGRSHPGAVILESSVHVVRHLHVEAHMVKLAERKILHETPALAPVGADHHTSVIPDDHPFSVGMDPHGMKIRMGLAKPGQASEGLARILADPHPGMEHVENILVRGIDPDAVIVKRTVAHVGFIVDDLPVETPVSRTQENALLGFHKSIDNLRFVHRKSDSHAPELSFGKPVFIRESLPGLSAVHRDVEAASGPTGFKKPGPSTVLPHGRDDLIRIFRVHGHVRDSGFIVHKEDLLPGLSAVFCFEYAPFGIFSPRCAHRTHIGHIRVIRMKKDLADLFSLFQTEKFPGLSAVDREIDTPAHADAVAGSRLACSDPDNIGIGLVDRDSPDRRHRLIVHDRRPGDPPVL